MRKAFTLMFPVLLLTVLSVGLVFLASATKGSYPGINGKIAFSDYDPAPQQSDREIFVMDNDGTNIEQLTHNDVDDGNPCWSPDGSKIAFGSARGGSDEIFLMNSDGSDQRPLTFNDDLDLYPDWQPIVAPVGGVIAPINKLEILTPYLALAGLITVVSSVYLAKRRKA